MTNYAIYGLKGNPFPENEIEPFSSQEDAAVVAKKVCVGVRQKEIDEIKKKFLQPILSEPPRATCLWVQGEIGIGKTFVFAHMLDQLGSKYANSVKTVYVEHPQTGISGIYDHHLRWLGRPFLADLSVSLVSKVLKLNPELINDEKTKPVLKRLARERGRKDELSSLVDTGRIDPKEVARFGTLSIGEGRLFMEDRFVNLVLQFHAEPDSCYEKLRAYPKGSRLDALATLFYLIRFVGFKMTVVFIDQLEHVWDTLTPHRKTGLAVDLRELVQRSLPNASFVVTTNLEAYKDMRYNSPTIFRALPYDPQKVVNVDRLSHEKVRQLVAWYLDRERKTRSHKCDPFTEEGIDSTYESLGGVKVGTLLVRLRGILESAADKKMKRIDGAFIDQYNAQTPVAETAPTEDGELIREEEFGR